jgi:dihydroorotate dehydrogenase
MERTSIRLGGVAIGSSIMNASGPHSAERGEIVELSGAHRGAIVFKSCNVAGLEAPDNLKNRGFEHFAALARELTATGKKIIGSVVGTSEEEFIDVASALDRAGVSIVELNLADDYVAKSVAPFASFERLKSLLGRVRGETNCVLAVKVPPNVPFEPRAIADLFKATRVAIAVCANDLPKDLQIDLASGAVAGKPRKLSQAHAYFCESENLLDIVAVGGINTGRDAYIAHLTGAKASQVGSALIKEGAGALARIDRELDSILAERGCKSVAEVIGRVHFSDS